MPVAKCDSCMIAIKVLFNRNVLHIKKKFFILFYFFFPSNPRGKINENAAKWKKQRQSVHIMYYILVLMYDDLNFIGIAATVVIRWEKCAMNSLHVVFGWKKKEFFNFKIYFSIFFLLSLYLLHSHIQFKHIYLYYHISSSRSNISRQQYRMWSTNRWIIVCIRVETNVRGEGKGGW